MLGSAHWSSDAILRRATAGELPVSATLRARPLPRLHARTLAGSDFDRLFRAESGGHSRFTMQVGPLLIAHKGEQHAGTTVRSADGNYVYPGPLAIDAETRGAAGFDAGLDLRDWLTIAVRARADLDRSQVDALYVAGAGKRVRGWLGRSAFGFGAAARSDLMLNDATPFDGIGISTNEDLQLFGLDMSADVMFARMERSGAIERPYFHAARIGLSPNAAFAIALSRALILGGEGNQAITPWRLLLSAAGLTDVSGKDSDFENQVATLDIAWRPVNSLLLYAQLGADDSGWAFARVPGIIAGAEFGWLHAEVTHISTRCCSYPSWYVHGALADGWTDRGTLLGHSLGGAGTQLLLGLRARPAHGHATARVFVRDRAAENLLAPAQAGRSFGVAGALTIPASGFSLNLRGTSEWGRSDWRSGRLAASLLFAL